MKRHLRAAAIWFALAVAPVASHAQIGADTGFVALRADGNGRADLQTLITIGFSGESAAAAFTAIADLARLNITLDPRLAGLRTRVTVVARSRTAAAALIEIATASRLRVRVSSRGQLVVSGLENENPTPNGSATRPDPVALPPVRSEASRVERERFETTETIGALSMTGQSLRSVPMFIEPDVLRAVQTLPGIEARSDWSAGFNVHGGESDQNLILLDGYPIYSPFHLGGVFSTFIDPTVGRVDLRKGSLPVRYGGRLSSVLDVSSAEPTNDELHGTAEVSLVSAIGSVGRTFADGNGTWTIAARRTYADAVVNLFKPGVFPYHFQDFQGHVTRRFDNGLQFSATGYDGLDVTKVHYDEQGDGGGWWGNGVFGATLSKTFTAPSVFGLRLGDSVIASQRASFTRFSTHVQLPQSVARVDNGVTDTRTGGSVAVSAGSHTHTFGYEVARQHITYETISMYPLLDGLIPLDSLAYRPSSVSLFADELWRPTPSMLIEGGLRLDDVQPNQWRGLSPRVAAKYFLSPGFAITAGAGSYAQWIHSLGREEEPIQPFEYWAGSAANTPVSRARDVTLGVEHWLTPNRLLHVEAFHKTYHDLLIPNTNDDRLVAGDEFTSTRGASYGIDFLLRQLGSEKFTGWIGYSYALNTRVGPDGSRYFPTQDRRHNLNMVGNWRAGAYNIGARINMASGLPTTPLIGGFVRSRYDATTHRWVATTTSPRQESIQGPFNSERLPWYQRIDVSVNRSGRLFGVPVSPYLSIVNVLNAKNPAGYTYSFTGRPEALSFPNLPFVPTAGVSIAY